MNTDSDNNSNNTDNSSKVQLTSTYSPESRGATYNYSHLPAANVISKYGVSKSTALFMLNRHWYIAPDWRDILANYYILRWQADYFLSSMVEGTIKRDGITYQVIYHNCDSVMVARTQYTLLLSFRALQSEYGAQPVVLVTIS